MPCRRLSQWPKSMHQLHPIEAADAITASVLRVGSRFFHFAPDCSKRRSDHSTRGLWASARAGSRTFPYTRLEYHSVARKRSERRGVSEIRAMTSLLTCGRRPMATAFHAYDGRLGPDVTSQG